MDFEARRRTAAAMLVAVASWFVMWFRRGARDARSITYGSMAERDEQRMHNLNYIYNSDDVHCVNLLRMRRAPFFHLCNLFRSRELLTDSIHASVEEQVANANDGAMPWYVVYHGRVPGVYRSWALCNAQVSGYANNSHKSFATHHEAEASYLEFIASQQVPLLDNAPGPVEKKAPKFLCCCW